MLPVKNNHVAYLILSISTAILLTLAWQPFKILPLVFIGFVPLLMLEKKIRSEQRDSFMWVFVYTWLALLLWNIGTVYWIWNASEGGALAAFVINSLPMVLPFMLYHRKNVRSGRENYVLLISAWIAMELLQFHWDLAFPWLQLGNVFSYLPATVQWYEYTGVLGGSLWICAVNIQLFRLLQYWTQLTRQQNMNRVFNLVFFYLLTPLFLSGYILLNHEPHKDINTTYADIILVQPNLDPYNDKFGGMSGEEQLRKMLLLAESKIDSLTQFIILPETALQGGLEENNLSQQPLVHLLYSFLKVHPNVSILTGIDSYRLYNEQEPHPATARRVRDEPRFFDAYNAALFINNYDSPEVYHKSKLVPGVEKMPYPEVFGFIEKYAINLGGTGGSLGSDGSSKVFNNKHKLGLAPIICYESVFAEFTASYVQKGAKILCIITNDGWWGNTPGYKQHFDYGRLRAIENRRYIARAANTGISGFIDDQGEVMVRSEWWTESALRMRVPVLSKQTFYTEHGDWIAYLFLFILGFELISLWRGSFQKQQNQKY
ncbi:MAG: apolipoprotein N-acyltransferase [Bacteroidia bacterium]|nr:apolipoprotein N-acyltransferase [Bacteroidia bacterium]